MTSARDEKPHCGLRDSLRDTIQCISVSDMKQTRHADRRYVLPERFFLCPGYVSMGHGVCGLHDARLQHEKVLHLSNPFIVSPISSIVNSRAVTHLWGLSRQQAKDHDLAPRKIPERLEAARSCSVVFELFRYMLWRLFSPHLYNAQNEEART